MWPKRSSETDREFWIQTGSKDCQYSNSNFSKSTRFYEGETTPRTCRNFSKLFIDSQKSNMQETDYAILKAKIGFSVFPAK